MTNDTFRGEGGLDEWKIVGYLYKRWILRKPDGDWRKNSAKGCIASGPSHTRVLIILSVRFVLRFFSL